MAAKSHEITLISQDLVPSLMRSHESYEIWPPYWILWLDTVFSCENLPHVVVIMLIFA